MSKIGETATLFVTCARGIESLLAEELKQLGLHNLRLGCRGVYVDRACFSDTYRINYCSRVASRVLWPLSRFRVPHREGLYSGTIALPWEDLIPPEATLAIDANIDNHPQLRHSHYAALVVKDAICDRLRNQRGYRPSIDREEPTVQLNLYIEKGWASLSWDTSGQPLHRRGYRQEGSVAPLQENLAAALLLFSGDQGQGAFCDPMCGSGTLLIEAALIATRTPPGFLRQRWGFMGHPAFSQMEWLRARNRADQERNPAPSARFMGIERFAETLIACRKNLRATGLSSLVTLIEGDCTNWMSKERFGWIATNPPYGVRLSQSASLFTQLANFAVEYTAPRGKILILTPEDANPSFAPLKIVQKYRLSNGGLPVVLYHCIVPPCSK